MQTSNQTITHDLWLSGSHVVSLSVAVLIVLVSIATVMDIRERRIPNWVVGTGILLGVLFQMAAPQGKGFIFALSGFGVGMGVLLPLYVLRAMGAGDVKLMGMVGTFLGTSGVIGTTLATMVAGGLLALGLTAYNRKLPQMFANIYMMLVQHQIRQMGGAITDSVHAAPSVGKMPYAVAILAGTLTQLFLLRY